MDDIVNRLRKNVNDEYLSYRHVLEAADEIERLQIVVKHLDEKFRHLESEIARLERLSNG